MYRNVLSKFDTPIREGCVVVHRAFSVDALATFPDAHFDWIYVDGAHDEANVSADLAACAQKMKPGGLIFGHDYTDRFEGFGVVPAVNRFIEATPWRMLALTIEEVPSFVLGRELDHPATQLFISLLFRLVPGMVDLPHTSLETYSQKVYAFDEGGHNIVMTF